MKHRQKALICIFAFILLFSSPLCEAQEYPTEAEHDWAGKYYFSVLEESFPLGSAGWEYSLGYRIHKEVWGEPEYSFLFKREIMRQSKGDILKARVKAAVGESLYRQIIDLRRKNPAASIETLKPQLKIKEWLLTEENCPSIRKQYDDFFKLSLEMMSAEDRANQRKGIKNIFIHPRIHGFIAEISGGWMNSTLFDSEHPLVLWAEKTRKAFEVCTQKQDKKLK